MRRSGLSIILSAAVFVGGAQFAFAQTSALQGSGATVAVAPRLHFTPEEMALAEAVASEPSLAAFYGANGLQPIFTGPEAEGRRDAVLEAIKAMPAHGIPSSRYHPDVLRNARQDASSEVAFARTLSLVISDLTGGIIDPAKSVPGSHREVKRPDIAGLMKKFIASEEPVAFLAGLGPQNSIYQQLQAELQKSQAMVAPADLPKAPEALWRIGANDEGVVLIRDRLAGIGFEVQPVGDPHVYDETLAVVVAQYQDAVGLHPDGVAGPNTIRRLNSDGMTGRSRAIAVALERMRWMGGEDLNKRMVWVNIPEYKARIIEGGQEVFQTRVVVGKVNEDLQTPEFSDQMEYLVVNPRWNVPRSITVKEYLPQLQANRYAVSHLDIVDGNGNVISRDRIDFGRYTAASFPYRMRQKPSDDNALGKVKFIFPNPWNIYLHDTPTKHLFANNARAYSHGCIRIGDPFDLSYELLSVQTDDPQAVFQRALATGKETWLKLEPEVPVHLVYFTAFPDETGQIRYFDDVYGRDAIIGDLLEKAGLDLGA